MTKSLGKIKSVYFGIGGYNEACMGITFTLETTSGSVGDFWGTWSIERSAYTKWTEADRITKLGEMVMRISSLLKDAKVEDVAKLKGIPVEVEFAENCLSSWRILKEVL